MKVVLLWIAINGAVDEVSLYHLSRFPTASYCRIVCDWLEARRRWHDQIGPGEPFSYQREWHTSEKERLYQLWYTWDNLNYAHNENYPRDQRIYWFRDLRSRIGRDNYRDGIMPEP